MMKKNKEAPGLIVTLETELIGGQYYSARMYNMTQDGGPCALLFVNKGERR